MPLFILPLLLLITLIGSSLAFSTQWSTNFDGSSGSNPDLPDWGEFLIGSCGGQNHRLSGGMLRMDAGSSADCFGAYYRENNAFPGTFPTDQDLRVTWRFRYNNLDWMGTQAGQVTGRFGGPQYYGISGVDSSVADYYHVESNGPWGSWNVNNPMWSSRSQDVWHTATFDFICDGGQMGWWMDNTNFHAVSNGPVLPPGDPARPYQIWFGNLLASGGANGWTAFDVDWVYVYAVERPQINAPSPGSGGTQPVSWNPVPNTEQPDGSTWGIDYQPRVCRDPNCADVVQTGNWTPNLSHTFSGLTLNQSYYYQVRARWVGTPELVTCWGNTVVAAMAGAPALSLAKSASSEVEPGGSVQYTLVVQNTGNGPATGVVVRDPIPQYVTNPTNISAGGSVQGNEIVWTLGALTAGESRTLGWQGTAATSIPSNVSQLVNTAGVTDDTGNSDEAQATTTILRSGISIDKTAMVQASPGQTIDYQITVRNTGQTTLSGVVARDQIPPYITNPTDISAGGSVQGSEIVWTLGTLDVGGSRTLNWSGTVEPTYSGQGKSAS